MATAAAEDNIDDGCCPVVVFWWKSNCLSHCQHIEKGVCLCLCVSVCVCVCVCVWTCACGGLCVWVTVEIDSSPEGPSVAWRWVMLTKLHVCSLARTHAHTHAPTPWGHESEIHTLYSQLNLSHFPPPFLSSPFSHSPGIAVWSISTTTCVRAVSFLGAPPRATSSTTPWWSTAHRWDTHTHTESHTHYSAPHLISLFHVLAHSAHPFNESTGIHTRRLWLLQKHIYADFQFEFITLHWTHVVLNVSIFCTFRGLSFECFARMSKPPTHHQPLAFIFKAWTPTQTF